MSKTCILILTTIIIVSIVPIDVSAGIICNDGWESSCEISGPGCCSHHGGVTESSNISDNYDHSKNSEDNKFTVLLIIAIITISILVNILDKSEINKN